MPDRGLDFGDGVFETLLVYQGRPLFLDEHLARLDSGLRILEIPDCLTAVRNQLNFALAENAYIWAAARINVLRGPGLRGYAPTEGSPPRILIYITELSTNPAALSSPANLGIAEIRLASQPFLARIKHLNRLEQVIATMQARAQGKDECIVLNHQDHIVSAITGNIYLVRNGVILTPSLETSGVAGTRRQLIMQNWACAIDMTVKETKLSLADLTSADEIFFSNALLTVRPVGTVGHLHWTDHSVCTALFEQFLGVLNKPS